MKKRRRTTNAFVANTWLPLKTFALARARAESLGQNMSQYLAELVVQDLVANDVSVKL